MIRHIQQCPTCHSTPSVNPFRPDDYIGRRNPAPLHWRVVCYGCGRRGEAPTREGAITAWDLSCLVAHNDLQQAKREVINR